MKNKETKVDRKQKQQSDDYYYDYFIGMFLTKWGKRYPISRIEKIIQDTLLQDGLISESQISQDDYENDMNSQMNKSLDNIKDFRMEQENALCRLKNEHGIDARL